MQRHCHVQCHRVMSDGVKTFVQLSRTGSEGLGNRSTTSTRRGASLPGDGRPSSLPEASEEGDQQAAGEQAGSAAAGNTAGDAAAADGVANGAEPSALTAQPQGVDSPSAQPADTSAGAAECLPDTLTPASSAAAPLAPESGQSSPAMPSLATNNPYSFARRVMEPSNSPQVGSAASKYESLILFQAQHISHLDLGCDICILQPAQRPGIYVDSCMIAYTISPSADDCKRRRHRAPLATAGRARGRGAPPLARASPRHAQQPRRQIGSAPTSPRRTHHPASQKRRQLPSPP